MSQETVTLKNGAEEFKVTVQAIMLTLTTLWQSGIGGIMQVYDLREICRNPSYRSTYIDQLKAAALLQPDGRPHDTVKNIVLSAVEGESLDMTLGSPFKTE